MPDKVHHDCAVLVVRVHRMKDVTRVDIAPHDVLGAALEREQADPALVAFGPTVWERRACSCSLEAEDDGKVIDHGVAGCEGHVVNRHGAADWDVDGPPHLPVDADDAVLHLVAPCPVVRDGMEFAGHGIALGMSGVAARSVPWKSDAPTVPSS